MSIVNNNDGSYPWSCLGLSLEEILKPLEISKSDFDRICDQFTNKSIFKTDNDGRLSRRADGSPIKTNNDNN